VPVILLERALSVVLALRRASYLLSSISQAFILYFSNLPRRRGCQPVVRHAPRAPLAQEIFPQRADFSCIARRYPYSAIANSLLLRGCERATLALGGRDNKLSNLSLPAQFPARAASPTKKIAKLTLWPLVAATFFMVSGGTYGTEDIIHGAGYSRGILALLLTPLVWSLPTAFMIGELSSALPCEGGYYAWVRRGMGNFWGFQEAWLSLVASIFDMAIYPTLFVLYLSQLSPWVNQGHHAVEVGLGVVIICALMNIAGIRVVALSSLGLFFLLSAPFVAIVFIAFAKPGALAGVATTPAQSSVGLVGGLLICMWNYMGWDNASTIAAEVRQPQKTYPRAMLVAVAVVSLTYVLPFAAMWVAGVPASAFGTGSWANLAGLTGGLAGGPLLTRLMRVGVVMGGMMSGFGMFNALVMSYSRLPLAMAQDGMLPSFFGKLHPKTRTPWVAILVLATGWALCLGLGFERLVTLDVLLYGLSLLLEFVALVALRIKEPTLRRPFRVPGGMIGAALLGVCPALLLGFSVVHGEGEQVLGMSALAFGCILIAGGVITYLLRGLVRSDSWLATSFKNLRRAA
jgi:amino acid transporter